MLASSSTDQGLFPWRGGDAVIAVHTTTQMRPLKRADVPSGSLNATILIHLLAPPFNLLRLFQAVERSLGTYLGRPVQAVVAWNTLHRAGGLPRWPPQATGAACRRGDRRGGQARGKPRRIPAAFNASRRPLQRLASGFVELDRVGWAVGLVAGFAGAGGWRPASASAPAAAERPGDGASRARVL